MGLTAIGPKEGRPERGGLPVDDCPTAAAGSIGTVSGHRANLVALRGLIDQLRQNRAVANAAGGDATGGGPSLASRSLSRDKRAASVGTVSSSENEKICICQRQANMEDDQKAGVSRWSGLVRRAWKAPGRTLMRCSALETRDRKADHDKGRTCIALTRPALS